MEFRDAIRLTRCGRTVSFAKESDEQLKEWHYH
jgi:hypothetical protein